MHAPKLIVLSTVLLLLSCTDDTPSYTSPAVATRALTENLFVPLTRQATTLADEFERACHAFCKAPTDGGLRASRDALRSLHAHWKSMEVMSFGPHRLFPYRTESRVDFWPLRDDRASQVLAGPEPSLSGTDAAGELGAADKGLPVAEWLLHGPNSAVGDFAGSERRCQYLVAVSTGIARALGEFEETWTGDFRNALLSPPAGDRYADSTEAFGELVNNVTFTVELIREKKLGGPLGMKAGAADPTLCESRYAERSIEYARASLQGVDNVFRGCTEDDCELGLLHLLKERNMDLASTYEARFKASIDALDQVKPPLTSAVVDQPKQVEAAVDALRDLVVFLQVEVTQALNVTVTFGGTDGD